MNIPKYRYRETLYIRRTMNKLSRNNWYYDDPTDAQELGKNWCVSVPYHDLRIIEATREMAKHKNCKSVSQYVRRVIWDDIRANKKELLSAHS